MTPCHKSFLSLPSLLFTHTGKLEFSSRQHRSRSFLFIPTSYLYNSTVQNTPGSILISNASGDGREALINELECTRKPDFVSRYPAKCKAQALTYSD
mmetsp:Transcript_12902/g.45318  ORF Transcript_12902/g.45318 Transcript_12902/m.45318 type:complete len:97 (+) Transcript_12902:620-910(+)